MKKEKGPRFHLWLSCCLQFPTCWSMNPKSVYLTPASETPDLGLRDCLGWRWWWLICWCCFRGLHLQGSTSVSENIPPLIKNHFSINQMHQSPVKINWRLLYNYCLTFGIDGCWTMISWPRPQMMLVHEQMIENPNHRPQPPRFGNQNLRFAGYWETPSLPDLFVFSI